MLDFRGPRVYVAGFVGEEGANHISSQRVPLDSSSCGRNSYESSLFLKNAGFAGARRRRGGPRLPHRAIAQGNQTWRMVTTWRGGGTRNFPASVSARSAMADRITCGLPAAA